MSFTYDQLYSMSKHCSYPHPDGPLFIGGFAFVVVGSITYYDRMVLLLSEIVRDSSPDPLLTMPDGTTWRYSGQQTVISNVPEYEQLRLQGD